MMTLQQKKDSIAWMQDQLRDLMREACEHCANNEPMHDEVVDGRWQHTRYECKASELHQLATHLDDVRDQHANEFNPKREPRCHWQCRLTPSTH